MSAELQQQRQREHRAVLPAIAGVARALTEEEKRHIAETVNEEELAIFDLLTKPDPALSEKEEREVKKVAQDLLAKVKSEKLVLAWRERTETTAAVYVTIEQHLDDGLPATYTPELFPKKFNLVYQHVYDSYYGGGASTYGRHLDQSRSTLLSVRPSWRTRSCSIRPNWPSRRLCCATHPCNIQISSRTGSELC